ncbi:hypothetical protein HXY33_02610 [Candidatus Bathyarchaeota archaeon]|nr:hypothetical protein [Candidatus Bathyarchaeota archaeon]
MVYADTSVASRSYGGESSGPQVCYSLNGGLKWATYDYPFWYSELVDAGTTYCDIALDTNFYPHISYYYDGSDLKYAHLDESGWHKTIIDEEGNVGKFNSIAIDSINRPHISYGDETMPTTNYKLKYAYYDGSTWQIQVVTDDFNGWGTSIAVDSNNRPHISYCGGEPNFFLMHAYYDDSTWQTETVDDSGNVGMWYSSIALDSSDRPRISYYDNDHQTLKYASWDGTTWQTETVDYAYGTGKFNCLALDPSGNPHISYSGTLKYASTAPFPFSEPSVGGIIIPIDELGLLTPHIGLISTILVTTVATALYIKHAKHEKEKH